jgi:integrase
MSLPLGSLGRRAESTLAENRIEAERLKKVFGHMPLKDLRTRDAVLYLRAGASAGRAAKANKEISLLRRVLQFALEEGAIDQNPFLKITLNQTRADSRLVTDQELGTMLWAGRKLGGAPARVALGLYVAMLCVRRSSELRTMRISQITESGILWTASKQQATRVPMKVEISWSPRLRVAISHAKRLLPPNAGEDPVLFGTRRGTAYTKGGWKATLAKLMRAAQTLAAKSGKPFQPFSLQHMRPMGVTTKRRERHDDVLDATLHTTDRMVTRVYDRRAIKVAKPAA